MSRTPHIWVLLLAILLTGCRDDENWRNHERWRLQVTDSRLPYGHYIFCRALPQYFPEAVVDTLQQAFRLTSINSGMNWNGAGKSLIILDGLDFYLSADEWKSLKSFISDGNEVMIFCSRLDDRIEAEVGCNKQRRSEEEQIYYEPVPATENAHVLTLAGQPSLKYGYPGRSVKGFFDFNTADHTADSLAGRDTSFSSHPAVLGYAEGKPDFIRYGLGDGHLTLHAAPLVTTNYFLLQDHSEQYLSGIWNTFPPGIRHVYWVPYFKRDSQGAGLELLMRIPATRWAIWLLLVGAAVYLLFESKRTQRIVPELKPVKNDSVSFVETVGRLYYNKRNHLNLAHKLCNQFLERVRTHYFLNTNYLNEDFVRQLSHKSGIPADQVQVLVNAIHDVRLNTYPNDEAYLYELYNNIQRFYNQSAR